jgi:hypothetical protein
LSTDDPINPKHYGGTACADIGERLSANSYQVLKYCWRLGQKDAALVELGKAKWYLEREIDLGLLGVNTRPWKLPDSEFFEARLAGRDPFVVQVAKNLISWNRHGEIRHLKLLKSELEFQLEMFGKVAG